MHLEEITSYQRLFAGKKLFDGVNPEERAKKIMDVYDDALQHNYSMTPADIIIRNAAETIDKTIRHNKEVCEKYPDALERVEKYRELFRQHKLVPQRSVKAFMQEVRDVYLAADILCRQENKEFKGTKVDVTINTMALILSNPSILETLVERLESDDIVE